MKNQIAFIVICISFFTSCIPQRKYAELDTKYQTLLAKNLLLDSTYKTSNQSLTSMQVEMTKLRENNQKLEESLKETEALYQRVKKSYDQLNENYEKRIENETSTQDQLRTSLKDLERKLEKKEDELNNKEAILIKKEEEHKELALTLEKLKSELIAKENLLAQSTKEINLRSERINELEKLLTQKENSVNSLKETLTKSLTSYKESGLTVSAKDGKVYVSMEEKLLFQSGKTDIDPKGKQAIQEIAKTLVNSKDFEILIEGHTDDLPIKTVKYDDNWDLSVLRATAITRILIAEKVDPKRIIPAGRGEYYPIDASKTKEARAKNRRIEIVLTPKLGDIMDLLNK